MQAVEQLTGVYFAQLRANMPEPIAKHGAVIHCGVAMSGNRLPRRRNRQCRHPRRAHSFSSGSPRLMHQKANSKMAAPHSVANQAIEIQTSTSSRFICRPRDILDGSIQQVCTAHVPKLSHAGMVLVRCCGHGVTAKLGDLTFLLTSR